MASTTEQSRKPQVSIGGKPVSGWIVLTGVLAVSILLLRMFGSEQVLPTVLTDNFRFTDWVNQAEAYLKDNYRWLTRAISDAILNVLERIEFFLWTAPWIGVVAAFALPGLAFGGLRLFILCILGGYQDDHDRAQCCGVLARSLLALASPDHHSTSPRIVRHDGPDTHVGEHECRRGRERH